MAIETKVPNIGTDEVGIAETLVRVGNKVEAERSLITVEGNKAPVEAPSPQAGIIRGIRVSVGDKTQADALIIIFDSADDVADAAPTQAEERKETAPAAAPAAAAAKDVNVPDIGSDEVEVIEILAKVDDRVGIEQSLITVEGDKASVEIPTPFTGTVKEIRVNMGDEMSIGSLIMVFEVAGEAGMAAPMAEQRVAPATIPAPTVGMREVNVPDIGGGRAEVTEVMAKVDDRVTAEQPLITVEDDKASMEVPAPFADVVKELKASVGDRVKTGSPIMIFEVEGAAPAAAPVKQEAATPVPATKAETPTVTPAAKAEGKSEFAENDAHVHATPLIRRLARESGVNLTKVKGTGRKGRALCEDVQAYVKEAIKRAEAAPAAIDGGVPDTLPQPEADFSKFGEIEEVELGCIQKISDANLSRNWVMIPHVTHFDKTDIIGLGALRKQQNEEAAEHELDMKITPVVFIMKTVVAALEQVPRFNNSLSEDGQRLTLKRYIDIGAAVSTPSSLVVPVFRDVSKKGIIELSRELMTISKEARDGELTAGEMQGGCFTASSIGGLGITHFASIMDAPEVAIPGVSKSAVGPVWNGKGFVPRLMLPVFLSFDRRMIDGTDSARFVTIANNTLSDIRRLVM